MRLRDALFAILVICVLAIGTSCTDNGTDAAPAPTPTPVPTTARPSPTPVIADAAMRRACDPAMRAVRLRHQVNWDEAAALEAMYDAWRLGHESRYPRFALQLPSPGTVLDSMTSGEIVDVLARMCAEGHGTDHVPVEYLGAGVNARVLAQGSDRGDGVRILRQPERPRVAVDFACFGGGRGRFDAGRVGGGQRCDAFIQRYSFEGRDLGSVLQLSLSADQVWVVLVTESSRN